MLRDENVANQAATEALIASLVGTLQSKASENKFEIDADLKSTLKIISMLISNCKTNQVNSELVKPVITALVNFFMKIMLKITEADEANLQSLRECRDSTIIRLNQLCEHGLISGDDAYRVACTLDFMSKSKFEKDRFVADLQIASYKNYAAKAGNGFAIREMNSENAKFIRHAWKQFLKDTAPQKYSLFKNQDRNAAIDLQKQLVDLAEGDVSTASNKHMVHLIAAFYLEQLISKGPKDNFISKLGAVIIDILVEMSQWDEKIKAVLEEEGKNAFSLLHQYEWQPTGEHLKSVLKIFPISLSNILTSLHMNNPEVNRTTDLGPEYLGPGYGSGHGL